MPEDSVLSAEDRRLVVHREVVEELDIEVLRTVAVVQIEQIERRRRAVVLRELRRAQAAAPGEVADGRHAMPIVGPEGDERAVVIAPAEAGVHADRSALRADARARLREHRAAERPAWGFGH